MLSENSDKIWKRPAGLGILAKIAKDPVAGSTKPMLLCRRCLLTWSFTFGGSSGRWTNRVSCCCHRLSASAYSEKSAQNVLLWSLGEPGEEPRIGNTKCGSRRRTMRQMEHDILQISKIEHLSTVRTLHRELLLRGWKLFVFVERHYLSLIRERTGN
jgi:hypothetical protein